LLSPQWGPPTPAFVLPVEMQAPTLAQPVASIAPEAVPEGLFVTDILPGATRGPGGQWVANAVVRQQAYPARDWPMLAIVLVLAFCLLAASLIDARHYFIPRGLSFIPAIVGLVLHAIYDQPRAPLSVMAGPAGCAWAIGGGVGLLVALALLRWGMLKRSFADELPPLEIEREAAGEEEVGDEEWARLKRLTRREMVREVAFLALPIGLGLLAAVSAAYGPGQGIWQAIADHRAA